MLVLTPLRARGQLAPGRGECGEKLVSIHLADRVQLLLCVVLGLQLLLCVVLGLMGGIPSGEDQQETETDES